MNAFDADVLSEIMRGQPAYVQRAARFSPREQSVPIVVVEEILRGRMNSIRQAEGGRGKLSVEQAYGYFEATVAAFQRVTILGYSAAADNLFQQWRSRLKPRIGTHDLRIAAICVASSATLITRNARDFQSIPGLSLEIWDA